MKYLVVSDIHGDIVGATSAIEAFQYHHADKILCLGDVLYHGPRNDLPKDYAPKKVIALLNEYANSIVAVRGNCEAEVDQMVLNFPCMADYNIIPEKNRNLFLTHGHIYSPNHLPILAKNDCFLSGHTHIPTCDKKDDIYLLNPGSISLPKQNHPRTYAILDEEAFTIYTLDHQEYMKVTF